MPLQPYLKVRKVCTQAIEQAWRKLFGMPENLCFELGRREPLQPAYFSGFGPRHNTVWYLPGIHTFELVDNTAVIKFVVGPKRAKRRKCDIMQPQFFCKFTRCGLVVAKAFINMPACGLIPAVRIDFDVRPAKL